MNMHEVDILQAALPATYNGMVIDDLALKVEPRKLYDKHFTLLKAGTHVLLLRKRAIQVHDKVQGWKNEFLTEHDVIPFTENTYTNWWEPTDNNVPCFFHMKRLTGQSVLEWSFVPDPAKHKKRVLAYRVDLLPLVQQL